MSYNNNRRFGGKGGRGNKGGYRGGRGRGSGGHSQEGQEVCKFFIEGRCRDEATCRRAHLLKKIGQVAGHDGAVKDVVMWESHQQLFTCSSDSTIKLWNCANWSEITTISVADPQASGYKNKHGSSGGVSVMILEGSWLFVGYEGRSPQFKDYDVGLIRAWNLDNPQGPPYDFLFSETSLSSHSREVSALAIATDATGKPTVFSGSIDGSLRYWQLDPTSNVFKCLGTLEGHVRSVTRLKTIVQGTMTLLISCSVDGTIKIYDLATMKVVQMLHENGHEGAITDLMVWVNQNEQFLITCGLDKNVIVWNLAPPFNQVFKEAQSDAVMCLCGTQDTKQVPILLLGLQNGAIVIKELPSFQYKTQLSQYANHGHREAVRRILAGPANTFFSVGEDRRTIAWQLTDSVSIITSN